MSLSGSRYPNRAEWGRIITVKTAILSLTILALATTARAQTRPDLSGTWVRGAEGAPTVATAGDAAFRVGDMGTGLGTPLTITQRRDSLVLEYVFFSSYDLQPPIRFAYAMDGSESPNEITIGHAATTQRARIVWRDSSVVITTRHPVPAEVVPITGPAVEVRQIITLASPTSIVVETTRPGGNGQPQTIRATYTKR